MHLDWKTKARMLTVGYLILNVMGALLFLAVASKTWIEPEVADIPGASGGAGIVWFLSAVPIFVLFVLLDSCFLLGACLYRVRHCRWPIT